MGWPVRIGSQHGTLQQCALVQSQRRVAGPDGGLIDLDDPDLHQIGHRHQSVADGDLEPVGTRPLSFGRTPAHQTVAAYRQPGRTLDQAVAQHLNRIIRIAGHQLPHHLLPLQPDRGRILQPRRRLIILIHLHLEGHPAGQSTIRRLGHNGPSRPAQALARLPTPLARRTDRKPRRSLDKRPCECSFEIRIRRRQWANRRKVLTDGYISDWNDDGVNARTRHRNDPAFLDAGHTITHLHQNRILTDHIRTFGCPLKNPTHREGHPVGSLQQTVGQRLLRQVRVTGGD